MSTALFDSPPATVSPAAAAVVAVPSVLAASMFAGASVSVNGAGEGEGSTCTSSTAPPVPSLSFSSVPTHVAVQPPTPTSLTPGTPLTPPAPSTEGERIAFRYVWPVRIVQRQLNHNDAIILHISPKFATVYESVAFQWTLRIHGSANLDSEDAEEVQGCSDYVATSLYFGDGPIAAVDVFARVDVVPSSFASATASVGEGPIAVCGEAKPVHVSRGTETELEQPDRSRFSAHIKARIGKVVRLALTLEMDASLFKPDRYLNAVSPTPGHSFLTANYRARVRSKIWRRRSKHGGRRPRGCCDSDMGKLNLEQTFNRVMDEERDRRANDEAESYSAATTASVEPVGASLDDASESMATERREHLFKKLLVACCDSCERRASLVPASSNDELDSDEASDDDDDDAAATFECLEANKAEMHDTLANMYFNRVALPQMEYVEDFADFLIDAELNELPVLKRACERYLCGELNSKKDLTTSLLLDLLFLALFFQLSVMKSLTFTALTDRFDEVRDVERLLQEEEFRKLDERVRRMSDRSLGDLVEECRKFRDQRRRVEVLKCCCSANSGDGVGGGPACSC